MGTYGDMLGAQLGTQAASAGLGGIFDMIFQPWRNENQLQQNEALMKQQIAGQKQIGQFNYDQQMKMWHATNSEAQMKHLKDAGLNPALMYGGGGQGGSTATGGQAGNVNGGMADPRAGGGYTGMNILMPAQVKLMEAQARNLDADTTKKAGVETNILTTENELKKLDLKVNSETLWQRINEIISRGIEQENKGLISGQQEMIGDLTLNSRVQQILQEGINTGLQAEVMKKGIELTDTQINQISTQLAQKWTEISQGWKALTYEERKTKVQELMGGQQKDEDQIINVISTIVNGLILKRFINGPKPPAVKGFSRGNKNY